MGRIMGIDFGLQRTGISVTDPNQIIVQGLETQKTSEVIKFIQDYLSLEQVDMFVIGYPFVEGSWGEKKFHQKLNEFINKLRKLYPSKEVHLHDERYSSMRAKEIIMQRGLGRKKSQSKELLDQTSAVIILQEYLGHI